MKKEYYWLLFSILFVFSIILSTVDGINSSQPQQSKINKTQVMELWESCESSRELIMVSDHNGVSITAKCFTEGV